MSCTLSDIELLISKYKMPVSFFETKGSCVPSRILDHINEEYPSETVEFIEKRFMGIFKNTFKIEPEQWNILCSQQPRLTRSRTGWLSSGLSARPKKPRGDFRYIRCERTDFSFTALDVFDEGSAEKKLFQVIKQDENYKPVSPDSSSTDRITENRHTPQKKNIRSKVMRIQCGDIEFNLWGSAFDPKTKTLKNKVNKSLFSGFSLAKSLTEIQNKTALAKKPIDSDALTEKQRAALKALSKMPVPPKNNTKTVTTVLTRSMLAKHKIRPSGSPLKLSGRKYLNAFSHLKCDDSIKEQIAKLPSVVLLNASHLLAHSMSGTADANNITITPECVNTSMMLIEDLLRKLVPHCELHKRELKLTVTTECIANTHFAKNIAYKIEIKGLKPIDVNLPALTFGKPPLALFKVIEHFADYIINSLKGSASQTSKVTTHARDSVPRAVSKRRCLFTKKTVPVKPPTTCPDQDSWHSATTATPRYRLSPHLCLS